MKVDVSATSIQDNGGQNCYGGNNWPLRGNKDTVWEGGIRGNSFVTGWGVPEQLRNTTSTGLMHVTDWLPTLAHIANASIADVSVAAGLWSCVPHIVQMVINGTNQYDMLFANGTSARTEILLQLDPPATFFGVPFIGQAAIRQNQWKLIVGQACWVC